MNAKKMFLTIGVVCAAFALSAQTPGANRLTQQSRDGGFSLHVGAALPIGNFGEEPMSRNDYFLETGRFSASPGINVGVKGKFPVAPNYGLGIFISADIIYNGLKGMVRDDFDDVEAQGSDVVRPKYINVPVFAGLNYRYDFTPKTGLWVEGGFGPNFRKITNIEATVTEAGETLTIKDVFKLQTSFGLQFGGGVMLNDCISIGVHYYGLGRSKIKGDTKVSGLSTEPFSYNRKSAQNSVMLRLGYHF
jgi:hypothetical protein